VGGGGGGGGLVWLSSLCSHPTPLPPLNVSFLRPPSALPTAGPYSTYEGSPVSKGVLQPDMWGVKPTDRWDWAGLRRDIAAVSREGLRGFGSSRTVW
jgi:hypothetical protein